MSVFLSHSRGSRSPQSRLRRVVMVTRVTLAETWPSSSFACACAYELRRRKLSDCCLGVNAFFSGQILTMFCEMDLKVKGVA